jgi:hypothetical protein
VVSVSQRRKSKYQSNHTVADPEQESDKMADRGNHLDDVESKLKATLEQHKYLKDNSEPSIEDVVEMLDADYAEIGKHIEMLKKAIFDQVKDMNAIQQNVLSMIRKTTK